MRKLIAILLGVALAGPALGASLMPLGKQAYWDANGNPLAGGLLYTYSAGTSTPLATYSDQAGTVPNANPVVLDARGEATIFWGTGPYKAALYTAAGALVWTQDYLYPPLTAAEPMRLYSGGNATTPELSWADDTNTGFYLIGADNVGLSLGGTKRWDFAASGSTLTGTLTVTGPVSVSSFSDAATFASSVTVSGVARFGPTVLTSTVTWLDASQLPPAAIGTTDISLFSTTSGSAVDVTGLTTSVTSHGRDVLVMLQPSPSSTVGAAIGAIKFSRSAASAYAWVSLLRDGVEIARTYVGAEATGATAVTGYAPLGSLNFLDVAPSAGSHTYKVQTWTVSGATVEFSHSRIVVREL